ncbi:hypothetical protein TNCT_282181 [Trichonephila clavata]|uniref:Secreted protein n=1 Tax=Trichonephila clavata TaxID=2740835 RepID=A0A8X6G0V8_TRICU|nr:hypothetical protein TNCT_282181 [Trichonephila clavata]
MKWYLLTTLLSDHVVRAASKETKPETGGLAKGCSSCWKHQMHWERGSSKLSGSVARREGAAFSRFCDILLRPVAHSIAVKKLL